jgi:hypothetical protein
MPKLRNSLFAAAFGLVLAMATGLCAAVTADLPVPRHAPSVAPSSLPTLPLADSWSWDAFVKFWKRQLEKTAGVVGVVLLVGAGAVVIIISKTRR